MNQAKPAVVSPPEDALSPALRAQAAAILAAWKDGAPPDARAALEQFPFLAENLSIIQDLAYGEFCQLQETGHAPDPVTFCARFPEVEASLYALLQSTDLLGDFLSMMSRLASADARMLRPGQAVPEAAWPRPGECLGDFTVVRELGRGAFARVFLATEAPTGDRPVAIKLSSEGCDEARTLGRLPHPTIVPVFSAGVDQASGLSVVCMPFLGGCTLVNLLDHAFPQPDAPPPQQATAILDAVRAAARPGDPVPAAGPADPRLSRGDYAEGVIHLGAQLAEVLAFLHDHGVCHRDLKPSNVLLGPEGRPLLLDFNLSADASLAPPRLGGTLPYAAPEHVRALLKADAGAALDGRADLFSLGVLLYELLTGRHPFGPIPRELPWEQLGARLLERQHAGFRPLRALNPRVDRPTARLIERCLALDPADRPATAAAVAAGLKEHFRLRRRLRRWVARRPRLATGLAALLLIALGATGWGWSQLPPYAEREYRNGVTAFHAGDPEGAARCFGRALQADPDDGRAWLALGLAQLRQAEQEADAGRAKTLFNTALGSLTQAQKKRPGDPLPPACWGYCAARIGHHDTAIAACGNALAAGFSPRAAILNNAAYCYLQQRNFTRAKELLGEALVEDPTLRAAYYNRAMVALKQPRRNNALLPNTAFADIRQALALGPPTPKLHFDAAKLFAAAARDDLRHKQKKAQAAHRLEALNRLADAIGLGFSPKEVGRTLLLTDLFGDDPHFGRLLAKPQAPVPVTPRNLQVINPAPPSLPN